MQTLQQNPGVNTLRWYRNMFNPHVPVFYCIELLGTGGQAQTGKVVGLAPGLVGIAQVVGSIEIVPTPALENLAIGKIYLSAKGQYNARIYNADAYTSTLSQAYYIGQEVFNII